MNCSCTQNCVCSVPAIETYNSRNSVDAFIVEAQTRARSLYRPSSSGTLVITASDTPKDAVALLTEQSPWAAKQHTVGLRRDEPSMVELPTGGYQVVARAPGFASHRGHVVVVEGQATTLEIDFDERAEAVPTLDSRAKYLGLELDEAGLTDLVLKSGKRQALDDGTDAGRSSMQRLTLTNIDQMKALLGQPDDYWAGEHPRYGVMVPELPDEVRTRDEENITLSTRFALREYVHGNSRSVTGWKDYLSGVVARSPFTFPVWLYRTVDVGAGCVLQIGAEGLFCGTLRVHRTGKVRIEGSGPTFVDVLAYEQYGFWEGPIVTTVHVKI